MGVFLTSCPMGQLVRAKGIEPSSSAWEADVLPLYHARGTHVGYYINSNHLSRIIIEPLTIIL